MNICFEIADRYKVVHESEKLLQFCAFLNAVYSMHLGLPAIIDNELKGYAQVIYGNICRRVGQKI